MRLSGFLLKFKEKSCIIWLYDETATVIKQFKGAVSKETGTTVWQKGFYDHIIRDDEDYNTKAQYIDTNPLTWERDELYTER